MFFKVTTDIYETIAAIATFRPVAPSNIFSVAGGEVHKVIDPCVIMGWLDKFGTEKRRNLFRVTRIKL